MTSMSASPKFAPEPPRSAELMVRLPDEVMPSISAVRAGLVIEAS